MPEAPLESNEDISEVLYDSHSTKSYASRRANEVFAVAFGYVGIGLKLVALTYNKVRVKSITAAAALTEILPSGTVHCR